MSGNEQQLFYILKLNMLLYLGSKFPASIINRFFAWELSLTAFLSNFQRKEKTRV